MLKVPLDGTIPLTVKLEDVTDEMVTELTSTIEGSEKKKKPVRGAQT